MPEAVGTHPQYDVFADEYLIHAHHIHAHHGLYNAHYDRPACLSLLGDVAGATVLDAACGPGLYAEELAKSTWCFSHWRWSTSMSGLQHYGRQVRYWLTPLERTCEELHEAGFLIERLLEPRPAVQAAAIDPEKYERLNREPTGFLAIRAVPNPR